VTQVDAALGRVLAAIEDSGTAADTLIIFTSDNGADWKPEDKAKFTHRANANWRGEKADAWDGGHRVPFIVRWPGQVKAGSVTNQLGCLSDFMATAAAITGFRLPRSAAEDSFNLLPAMKGEAKAPIREAVVHHSSLGMFAIREGNWKLIPAAWLRRLQRTAIGTVEARRTQGPALQPAGRPDREPEPVARTAGHGAQAHGAFRAHPARWPQSAHLARRLGRELLRAAGHGFRGRNLDFPSGLQNFKQTPSYCVCPGIFLVVAQEHGIFP
jgi:arylsulfatase A-like enzyme